MNDQPEHSEHNVSKPKNMIGVDGPLVDNFGREITYLRLAVTDRCNLRCCYCMPEEGVPNLDHNEITSFEELETLVRIFVDLGVKKVRLTGGEPFVRKGIMDFIERLLSINGISSLYITTNGVAVAPYVHQLKDLGLAGINLSLDTVVKERFLEITRRDHFEKVMETLHNAIECKMPLKINSVVLDDTNDDEILKIASLAKQWPITVRFIEKMPFSGTENNTANSSELLQKRILRLFPDMKRMDQNEPTTSKLFMLPSFAGTIGIIEGYSRNFCQSCNKIRITPQGMLKTCLYDNGIVNLKSMLRSRQSIKKIRRAILQAVNEKHINGQSAQKNNSLVSQPSMASIGG